MTARKTYDLPIPTNTREANHIWLTGHLIATDGEPAHDGTVTHYPRRLTITVDTHEGEVLVLDYADARRVALALLAAVEEFEMDGLTCRILRRGWSE